MAKVRCRPLNNTGKEGASVNFTVNSNAAAASKPAANASASAAAAAAAAAPVVASSSSSSSSPIGDAKAIGQAIVVAATELDKISNDKMDELNAAKVEFNKLINRFNAAAEKAGIKAVPLNPVGDGDATEIKTAVQDTVRLVNESSAIAGGRRKTRGKRSMKHGKRSKTHKKHGKRHSKTHKRHGKHNKRSRKH